MEPVRDLGFSAKRTKLIAKTGSSNTGSGSVFDRRDLANRAQEHLKFRDFRNRFSQLDEAQFLSQFNHPFLLEFSGSSSLSKPARFFTRKDVDFAKKADIEVMDRLVFFLCSRVKGIETLSVTIGRVEISDLWIPDAHVSKFHAAFHKAPECWQITDQESLNGTFINGHKLESRKRYNLQSGQTLGLSAGINLIFLDPLDTFMLLDHSKLLR